MGRTNERVSKPIIYLENPDLPEVPDDFKSLALHGMSAENAIWRSLYDGGRFAMRFSINKAGATRQSNVLAGHRWKLHVGEGPGPTHAKVMVVGKATHYTELETGELFSGEYGDIFLDALVSSGINSREAADFYVTNLLKTPPLEGGGKFPKLWVQNQIILLWQEFMLVKPELVLLQGNDVIKAVLGSKASLGKLEGQVVEKTINCKQTADSPDDMHTIKFVVCSSPAAVMSERARPGTTDAKFRPHAEKRFHEHVKQFAAVYRGGEPAQLGEDFEWELIDDADSLIDALQRMRNEAKDRLVAWDAEWQGEHPQNDGAYVRCIQFAWKKNHACVLALTHPGGEPRFSWVPPGKTEPTTNNGARVAAALCKKFMRGMRVCGHYFVADLEQLIPLGLDLRAEFDAAASPEDAKNGYGGVATELMAHAWEETALFSLDEQIAAHLDVPKYSSPLDACKAEAAKEAADKKREGLKPVNRVFTELKQARRKYRRAEAAYRNNPTTSRKTSMVVALDEVREVEARIPEAIRQRKQVEEAFQRRKSELNSGYGWMPDEVLYPYGAWDAYAELELGWFYIENLSADRFGNDCWQAYWLSHQAALPVLEINRTGLLVDRKQVDEHSRLFARKRDALLQRLRDVLRWPDFNPRSNFDVAEMLFGEKYNGYLQRYGKKRRCRPRGATTLRCEPLRSTGKYPEEWAEVRAKGKENTASPSSSKQSLGEMYHLGDELRVREWDPDSNRWIVKFNNHQEALGLLRDFRYIDQALKGLLRDPNMNADGSYAEGEDGLEYDAGVVALMCGDGRVRTRIRQTLETGRWASSSPNLQNQCYDEETEILTPRGWVSFPELGAADRVAQFDPNDESITFVEPLERQVFNYSGDLVAIEGEQVDLLVTPNHRCLLRNRRNEKWRVFEADEFPSGKDGYHHYHAGKYAGGSDDMSADFLRFLVAAQADGSWVMWSGKRGGLTFTFSKQRKVSRLLDIVKSLDLVATVKESHPESAGKPVTTIHVTLTGNEEFLNEVEKYLTLDKQFGPWITELSQELLCVFTDEVKLWDGTSTRRNEFFSRREESVDWVQIAHVLSGQRCNKRVTYPRGEPFFWASATFPHRKRPHTSLCRTNARRIPAGDIKVYCVTVPTSFVVVRRNGKVSVSGNSNSRQADYVRICGPQLKSSLRTIFTAPEGHFFIHADYSGAELMMMAIMSQDEKMIDHCQRNVDGHPDFYDIHSNLTVKTFQLQCEPTKEGLASIGKAHLRTLGKAAVFGIAYGRGPKALAVSARQEGVFATEDEARALRDGIFKEYPKLREFFDETHKRVGVGWMRNMFGRFRRFPYTTDDSKYQALCREAQNAAIQGGVADAMSLAIRNIYNYRNKHKMEFQICLQIHDALMLQVPAHELMTVIDRQDGVFKKCMVDQVELWPTNLIGEPLPVAKPYHFNIDIDIYGRWGEVATPDRFLPYGLDPSIAGWKLRDDETWVWKDDKKFAGMEWDRAGNPLFSS